MDTKNLFQSKKFKKIILGIGIAVAVLIVFQAGMFVGYRKAAFSYKWGDNYYQTFGEHRRGGMMGLRRDVDFSNSHGTIGKIIKIELPSLTIQDQDGTEKIVVVKDDTIVKKFRETINPVNLKIDDFVVIIGSPNEGSQIEAKLVRIMPYVMSTSTRIK